MKSKHPISWNTVNRHIVFLEDVSEGLVTRPGFILYEVPGRKNRIRSDRVGHRVLDNCAERVVGFDPTHTAVHIRVQMRIGDMQQS